MRRCSSSPPNEVNSALDWDRARDTMARPFVLDGRNLFSPREMMARGFEYPSFGRSEWFRISTSQAVFREFFQKSLLNLESICFNKEQIQRPYQKRVTC